MTLSTNNQVQVSVNDLLDTLNSVQAEEATKASTGIAPRPAKETSKDSEVLGFFRDMFANSQAKAAEARESIQPEMYRLAKDSAYEVSQARQMAGITSSLTEGGGEIGRKPLPEGTTLRPVAKPPMTSMRDVTGTDEGKLNNEQPLRDLADAVANEQITSKELEPAAKDETDEVVNSLVEQLTTTRLSAGKDVEEAAPVTAEAETTEATTGGAGLMSRKLDSKGETPKSFFDTGTFKLLEGVEGFKSEPYSLNKSATINGKPHKSGLTVGAGIDFGQHTRASLEKIGLPKTMLDKAESAGWIGLNPDTIIDPKTGAPAADRKRGHALMYEKFKQQKKDGVLPSFTKSELNLATPAMYKPYEDSAKKQMDSKFGEGTYDSLGEGTKAVLTLEKYHRGKDYTLPEAMLEGAMSGNPMKAAEGISWSSRRKNMKDWIKKVGLLPDTAPKESVRPKLRPEKTEE